MGDGGNDVYVMSYFGTEAEALHLALSDDGLHWQALNNNRPILHGTVGAKTLRDPFICADQGGTFHLLATNGWNSDHIVHATSPDLLRWSEQELLPVMAGVPGVRNCWAPECFYDAEASVYRLIWSTAFEHPSGRDDRDHRIWATATADWVEFALPHLFCDPGHSVIDATVVRDGGRYLMAYKDERGENARPPSPGQTWKAIRVAAAPAAGGPWTDLAGFVTPSRTEGPTLFRRSGEWVMIFDHFCEDHFGAAVSSDGVQWTSITHRMTFPPGPRHATVLAIPGDGETAQRLRELLPQRNVKSEGETACG